MYELVFTEAADISMRQLEADPQMGPTVERTWNVLDAIGAAPLRADVNRRHYRVAHGGAQPRGVPFRSQDEDWLVLWEFSWTAPKDEITILYVGPDI
jgi:hypothetical protein